jgi:hypothetical protein
LSAAVVLRLRRNTTVPTFCRDFRKNTAPPLADGTPCRAGRGRLYFAVSRIIHA